MIKYFAAHPTASNLLMIIICIAGLMSMGNILIETFPEFSLGEVEIIVEYPGASPAEVEESICLAIENALEGTPGLDEFEITAQEGMARATVKMVSTFKFQSFLSDVKTRIEAITDFPGLVDSVIIQEKAPTDPVVSIALAAPLSLNDLKIYAEDFKDKLLDIEGINIVKVTGLPKHYLKIRLLDEKLKPLGLTPQSVAAKLFSHNIEVPGGIVKTQSKEYLIRYTDQRKTQSRIEDIVILHRPGGVQITLGQIAQIEDTFEPYDIRTVFNNNPAIVLSIEKNSNENAVTILDLVKQFVKTEKKELPDNVTLEITRDVTSIVNDRLSMIKSNGLQGFFLVFLVLLFFFKPGQSFWVAAGLPVSFLGSMFFMQLLGISFNMISMVGLLMAIGLLMDDAVVISENILSRKNSGIPLFEAIVSGTHEVLPGVLSSYLTTICVFGGLMFLDGDLGRMFKDMPKVLLLVMSVSLIEAFLILPHHLFSSFSKNSPGPENSNSIHTKIDRKFEFFKNNYLAPLIKKAIQYRYIFVGFLIFIFFISAAMIAGRRLKFSALPEIDGDVIEARLIMPAGTPVNITKKHVNKIVSALKQADKDNNYVLNITEKYGINQDANESGGHLATVTADLLTAEKRKGRLDDLTNRWRDSTGILPGIESISFKEPFVGPAGKPIHIQLYSRHFHVLEHISRKLVKALSEYEGITDIISDMRSGKPEIRIKLKESAEALGISAMEISSQLRSAFYGSEGGIIYNNEEPREIAVELSRYDQTSLTVLDDFRIQDKNNNKIPLYELVEVVYARNLSQISRTNRKRCLNIYAEIDKTKGNVIEIMGEIEKSIVKPVQALEPTLTYEFKGEIETMNDVRPTMGRAVMLGIIGIFIILSFQFKSYKEPVLIMGAVPLALVGVVWGHILMGYDLAMPSMVGFISLAGIVVNNSIILVQFIGINMAAKKISLSQAALEAALQRFRPILITSLTTVAGMTPLLLEKSLQAQILIPLTISVIFGMSVSTLLILFFIPAIYTILDDFK